MGHWFRLHFIENEGMAYGMKLSESPIGKIILSSFRLVAVSVGFYALKWLLNKGYSKGMLICGSLILAGALGNLLDSMFYGLIFSDSPYSCFSGNYNSIHDLLQNPNKDAIAHFTSFGHGYGKFLQGKVVDMFYFPVIETTLPGWVPFWGGRSFTFFEPVFNLADAAISVGIFTLLLFQKRLMDQPKTTQPPVATETQA
jgi:signal peptidase II